MTDLTDKWKKGELPDGLYYVKTNDDSVMILGWSKIAGWYNIKQVLAPVPSYEEWQSMDRLEKIMLQERAKLNKQVIELLEKNTKLKEQINKYILDSINRGTANAVTAVKEFGMPERIEKLVKQNTKLKELLKECYTAMEETQYWDMCKLLPKINQALGEDK